MIHHERIGREMGSCLQCNVELRLGGLCETREKFVY